MRDTRAFASALPLSVLAVSHHSMRKVRSQDVKASFATYVTDRLSHFGRLELSLKGTVHEKRDLSLLSETTLHSLYVAYERFVSDLFLACMNRDFSAYQNTMQARITSSVSEKFGSWAAARLAFFPVPHIKVDDLESIVDPKNFNLTFKDFATLKQKAQAWLAVPHASAIVAIPDADMRLVDTVHAIRDFVAHQSPSSKVAMNQRLASVVTGPGCPNSNLSRGQHDVHDVGAFLKSMVVGQRRVRLFAARLSAIAAKMAIDGG